MAKIHAEGCGWVVLMADGRVFYATSPDAAPTAFKTRKAAKSFCNTLVRGGFGLGRVAQVRYTITEDDDSHA